MEPFIAKTLHKLILKASTKGSAGQADQPTDRNKAEVKMSIPVDHEVGAELDGVKGGVDGVANADAGNMVFDANGKKKTKTTAVVKNSTFTGNVTATAKGPTVLSDPAALKKANMAVANQLEQDGKPKSFQTLVTRMEAILENAFFDAENKFVDSTDRAICDFKNNPMELSVIQINKIAGHLKDVETAFDKQRRIETKLKALTKALDEIKKGQ